LPKIDSQGRVTIPKKVRDVLELRSGVRLDFVELEKGRFAIVPINGSIQALNGLFKGRRQTAVTLEEMDMAIVRGASISK
jgi:antitoxin PrlF